MKRIIGFICLLNCCILPFSFAQIKVTKENGITVVQNPAEPLDKKVKELKFIEEVRFGDDNDNNYFFTSGNRFLIDSKQNIYLFPYKNSLESILKFDKNGKYINTIIKHGAGPEECRSFTGINIDEDDNIIIYDDKGRRVNIYSTDGKHINYFKTTKIDIELYPHENILIDEGNIIFYKQETFYDKQIRKRSYFSYDQFGRFVRNVVEIDKPIVAKLNNGEGRVIDTFNPILTFADKYFIAYKNMTYEFDIHDKFSSIIKYRVKKEYEPQLVDFKSREWMEKEFGRTIKYKTHLTQILYLNNEIWIKSIEKDNILDIFTMEGKFVKQYKMPTDKLIYKWKYDKKTKTVYAYSFEEKDESYYQFIRYRVEIK